MFRKLVLYSLYSLALAGLAAPSNEIGLWQK